MHFSDPVLQQQNQPLFSEKGCLCGANVRNKTMNTNCVSKATLGRLPVYLRYLRTLGNAQSSVSATGIAKALGYGEVQVRKDLGAVSGMGKPKTGYETQGLIRQLESYLTQKGRRQAVIAGAGKLGRALLDYEGFSDYDLEIAAAFDIRSREPQFTSSGKSIYPLRELENYCFRNDVRIGIVAVPKEAAQDICNRMVKAGISAIWNFAPVSLCVPETVHVTQENLALSLAHLNMQI